MTTTITSSKITTGEINWTSRQPEELDFLRPNGFRFMIQSLPKVTYFCQAATIPNISLSYATQSTPFVDIPRPGEKIDFSELTIKFIIQEDMANYIELFDWMIALGFPENHRQFQQRFTQQSFRLPEPAAGDATVNDRPGIRSSDLTEYSDAALLVLNSDNLPIVRLNFVDCFPTSLTGMEFDVSTGNTQYFTAQASFRYRMFTIETL